MPVYSPLEVFMGGDHILSEDPDGNSISYIEFGESEIPAGRILEAIYFDITRDRIDTSVLPEDLQTQLIETRDHLRERFPKLDIITFPVETYAIDWEQSTTEPEIAVTNPTTTYDECDDEEDDIPGAYLASHANHPDP